MLSNKLDDNYYIQTIIESKSIITNGLVNEISCRKMDKQTQLFGEKVKPEDCLINKIFETNIGNLFIKKELGKGKSGYSYLAEFEQQDFVLKLMHNEPCHYYLFGDNNKVKLEISAYHRLKESSILLPELLTHEAEKHYLIKEYIDGQVASELIAGN